MADVDVGVADMGLARRDPGGGGAPNPDAAGDDDDVMAKGDPRADADADADAKGDAAAGGCVWKEGGNAYKADV